MRGDNVFNRLMMIAALVPFAASAQPNDGVITGYRNDGAKVIPLLENEGFLTVGAFGPWYVDIYTFDLVNRDVGWTSNKHGPISAKAAAYSAKCE